MSSDNAESYVSRSAESSLDRHASCDERSVVVFSAASAAAAAVATVLWPTASTSKLVTVNVGAFDLVSNLIFSCFFFCSRRNPGPDEFFNRFFQDYEQGFGPDSRPQQRHRSHKKKKRKT